MRPAAHQLFCILSIVTGNIPSAVLFPCNCKRKLPFRCIICLFQYNRSHSRNCFISIQLWQLISHQLFCFLTIVARNIFVSFLYVKCNISSDVQCEHPMFYVLTIVTGNVPSSVLCPNNCFMNYPVRCFMLSFVLHLTLIKLNTMLTSISCSKSSLM